LHPPQPHSHPHLPQKCIGLQANSEPEIFHAIRFGTVLENVAVKPETRQVHYASSALTENTRAR
jgi:phosphoenolpyruvate carboxykinase (ATP)